MLRTSTLISLCLLVAPSASAEQPAFGSPTAPNSCAGRTDWRIVPGADGTPPQARELGTWLGAIDPRERDRVLLDADDITLLNLRNGDTIGAWQDPLAEPQRRPEQVEAELLERLNQLGERVAAGEYVEDVPGAFMLVRGRIAAAIPIDEARVVHRVTDLRCVPLASGLYRGRIDRLFDRNQCSRLHPAELVRVLRITPEGDWAYVRAGHGVGWLDPAALGPPMPLAEARALRDRHARLTILGDWVPARRADGETLFLRFGTGVPIVAADDDAWQVLVPTPTGWDDAFVARGAHAREGFLPLTRRNFLALLFARLDDPYGWGGTGSGRDCSALLLDAAASFDLRLGRNSSVQGIAGWTHIDVANRAESEKLAAIRAAAARGIVFLYMPGHIMVYLGELDGRPFAISSISEYLLPCPEGGHRTVRLDRTEVTDLERGRGTERTSFLERITHISIFGR